jgi:hypothetical protein
VQDSHSKRSASKQLKANNNLENTPLKTEEEAKSSKQPSNFSFCSETPSSSGAQAGAVK